MNKIEKRSDLHREYARIIDMCEGTNVKPNHCIRYAGASIGIDPKFTGDCILYNFAIAIVDNKPVFVGDTLYDGIESVRIIQYDINNNILCRARCDFYLSVDGLKSLSWNPQKPKTFNLNGVELPRPFEGSCKKIDEYSHSTTCEFTIRFHLTNDKFLEARENIINS